VTRPVILAIIAPLVMVGVLFVTLRGGHAGGGKPPAALQGTWVAKGVVEASRGSSDQPAGTRLTRRWVFFTRCTGASCVPWLARESADGYEQAPVARRDGGLEAVFTRGTNGCGTPRTGELKRTFRISSAVSGGGLLASEAVAGVFPGCTESGQDGHTTGSLSWTVTKVSTGCPGMRGCREQR
jgi:hypothetical protein